MSDIETLRTILHNPFFGHGHQEEALAALDNIEAQIKKLKHPVPVPEAEYDEDGLCLTHNWHEYFSPCMTCERLYYDNLIATINDQRDQLEFLEGLVESSILADSIYKNKIAKKDELIEKAIQALDVIATWGETHGITSNEMEEHASNAIEMIEKSK